MSSADHPSAPPTGLAGARKARPFVDAAFWVVVVVALVGSYVAFFPFSMGMPGAGLDPSWVAVLGEAGARGWASGSDVIFTGGPLSSIYTGYFDEHLFWFKLGLRFLLVVSLGLLIASLAWQNRRLVAGLLFGLSVAIFSNRNGLILAFPMLTALVAIDPKSSRPIFLVLSLGIAATAAVTLAKFSVAPFAVLAFLACDVIALYRRRLPLYLVSYAAATFVLYCLVDQPASFGAYLTNSLSVMAGYSDAMAFNGDVPELLAFLALSSTLQLVIAWSEARAALAGRVAWPIAATRGLLIAVYLFMVWKVGFVRHDLHSLSGWSGLALACLTYAVIAPRLGEHARPAGQRISALFAAVGYAILLLIIPGVLSAAQSSFVGVYSGLAAKLRDRAAETRQFAIGPSRWLELHRSRKQAAWGALRDSEPLPRLEGTVDIIPSLQSIVLANGLDYHPRPSFQEYGTYTGKLIELNRRSLVEDGPDYLLFRPGSIDNRYPSLAEGALWPDIIRLYEPNSVADGLLVLRRRAPPVAGSVLGPETMAKAAFGEAIALPAGGVPLFMTARIRKTWLGRLGGVLFRLPLVIMQVTYADGRERRFRVVPDLAAAGFFISPTVSTIGGFNDIVGGYPVGRAWDVERVSFASPFQSWFYQSEIAVAFRPLVLGARPARMPIGSR